MKNPITIVLTGGGSGGHVTPLLSLAHALKEADSSCRVIYIGPTGDKLEGLSRRYQLFDEVRYVPAGKFRRYHGESFLAHLIDVKTITLNIRDFFRVIRGVFTARRLLATLRPDVVFSKGGFVAVPVGIAARLRRIPIVTHDSDAVPGLANRIIGRWAKLHATGMPAELYGYPKDKTRYTGIPVDERLKPVTASLQAAYKKDLGIQPSQQVLLVGGAGMGSQDVNDRVLEIAEELLNSRASVYLIHITGQQHLSAVTDKYTAKLTPEQGARVKVLGFTDDFYKYTGAADLIVSRAGATTIAELAIQAKPCLLIPASFLAGGHQIANAEALAQSGAARVLPADSQPSELLAAITELLDSDTKRAELSQKLSLQARPEASRELAGMLLSAVGTTKAV